LEVIFQAQSISRVILSIMQLQMNEYTWILTLWKLFLTSSNS
jgi:hypothetical protein